MSSTEKVKGATQTCSGCQTNLICNEITKEWNGNTEKKLQWQDTINKKPHFKKNMGTGKYDCINIPEGKPICETREAPEKKRPTNDDYLKKKQAEIQQHSGIVNADKINIQMDILLEIESIVTKKLTTTSDPNPNPAKVGMYMKIIYGTMEKNN